MRCPQRDSVTDPRHRGTAHTRSPNIRSFEAATAEYHLAKAAGGRRLPAPAVCGRRAPSVASWLLPGHVAPDSPGGLVPCGRAWRDRRVVPEARHLPHPCSCPPGGRGPSPVDGTWPHHGYTAEPPNRRSRRKTSETEMDCSRHALPP